MPRFTLQDAQELYRVDDWADGHLRIGKNGTLEATPLGPGGPGLDLHQVVEELRQDGMTTPVVLRFPQVLAARVDRINQAFADALAANECGPARYRGVFPIKVNQHQHVVKELAKAGRRWRYGLEVGSKAELVAALTMDPNRGSLLVVNGFKDKAYLKAACAAAHLKDEVIVVMDEIGELDHLIELLAGDGPRPLLGLRLKLRSKAPGKWALSGGDRSKFGLTIPEALHAVDRLRAAGLLDRLAMLHFHIGSQISDIRRIAGGVREAARIHAEMVKLGVDLRLLDVGGGLAVDYDGSGSSGYNSANYSMEEYANTVVATVKDVMDEHDVAMPDIISESGRSVVTHHAVLVVSVLRRVPGLEPEPGPQQDDDPTALVNLYQARAELGPKNLFETFHDVLGYREDLQHLFDLGHLSLETMGRSEALLRSTMKQVARLLEQEEEAESEEYQQAAVLLEEKVVCNFSLFQSLPDVWGVKQQFPIVPLHRLKERPAGSATVADITCDSDGEIRRFIDHQGTSPRLALHADRPGEPYHLAVALVGAYQDALGDYHNLFGETNEAWITMEPDGSWSAGRRLEASRVVDMLEWVRYQPSDLRRRLRRRIARLEENGRVDAEEAKHLMKQFQEILAGSSYLDVGA